MKRVNLSCNDTASGVPPLAVVLGRLDLTKEEKEQSVASLLAIAETAISRIDELGNPEIPTAAQDDSYTAMRRLRLQISRSVSKARFVRERLDDISEQRLRERELRERKLELEDADSFDKLLDSYT